MTRITEEMMNEMNEKIMVRAKAMLRIFNRTNTPIEKEHFMKITHISEEQFNEIVK